MAWAVGTAGATTVRINRRLHLMMTYPAREMALRDSGALGVCLPVCVYAAGVPAGAGTRVDRIGAGGVIAGDAGADRTGADEVIAGGAGANRMGTDGVIAGDAARDRSAAGVIVGDAARGTRATALANERPGRPSHQFSSEAQPSGIHQDCTAASRLED